MKIALQGDRTSGSRTLARGGLGWGPPDVAKPRQEEIGWHPSPYRRDRLMRVREVAIATCA
ncbi:hypothetical protein J0895_19010 [Phormidium pseudopriestleyi FRX01]|uniref:Uncharacterized protein n=1 Tax=Phormidium pseudopriestleyi FRX01 TaxID=1759528 RepID=A0ABS3FVH0_9CYAN|nr:hypothetical protein [Phormidium pseudopriestleyi]MBO0351123.1 hypothetical protein [Phormidium pseudopriestleyi FRX01]